MLLFLFHLQLLCRNGQQLVASSIGRVELSHCFGMEIQCLVVSCCVRMGVGQAEDAGMEEIEAGVLAVLLAGTAAGKRLKWMRGILN